MTKTIDAQLATRLREESEATREEKYSEGAVPARPNLG